MSDEQKRENSIELARQATTPAIHHSLLIPHHYLFLTDLLVVDGTNE